MGIGANLENKRIEGAGQPLGLPGILFYILKKVKKISLHRV